MSNSSSDITAFKEMLTNLLSADNSVRFAAEALYYKLSIGDKHRLLLSAINDDNFSAEESELAAILLRRLISSDFDAAFAKMTSDIQHSIKSQLLLRLQQNISSSLRRKIGDVTAELARNLIDENGTNHWPEFLSFLFEGAQSTDPVLREIVLLIFSAVPGVFGNQQTKYISVIHQMLSQNLDNHQPQQVRYAAVQAFCSFILANEKEIQVQKQFTGCLVTLLHFFDEAMKSKDAEPDIILRNLIDLVEICPRFFRSHLDDLFKLCLKGISDPELLSSTRQLSLEVIVTISETAPAMVRKRCSANSDNLVQLIILTLKMMTDVEDVPNWDFIDDEFTSDDEDNNANVAESSLDRLACALGGKTVLPLVMAVLPQMLNSVHWKERYAGLMVISAIGEGCHNQMTPMLTKIVDGVIPFLFDQSHTRVRFAACNAIGQMSSDFAPTFQKKFSEKVVTNLLFLFNDPTSPRVQAHAGAALVNFFEDCPKNILTPYINSIIHTLEAILSTKLKELADKGTKLVLEQVVVTLASLADSVQEKFIDYYDKFMPCLTFIIQNTNQPHLLMLRGKTIECVSLIGLAVGKEKFLPDANEVMKMLLKSQSPDNPISEDDPQLSYMITAWARICKILGKEFEPYLQFVMGPVLKAAALKPEIAVLDTNDMKVVGNDVEWEFVHLGEKHNFGIRTSGLDEKATACQMLVCYAKELKESFAPYVEETLKLMLPMLKFYFHEGVRIAAGEIMPCLLESAKVRGDLFVREMWKVILPALLQCVDSEPEPEVLCDQMTAFAQSVDVLNSPCLTHEDLITLINILDKHLKAHFVKLEDRINKRKEEDYDEALEEDLLKEDDEDVYILSKISEIICTLFGIYKQEFFNYFNMLLPHFIKLLEPGRSWQDRQWSLCVFADMIEFCGPACSSYQQYFLQPVLDSLNHENPDLRQTAAYAIGILAQHGGPEFVEVCAKVALPQLIAMINNPESRSEENERATENAISSVAKMFVSNNPFVEAEKIIPTWITWLPIWEDEEETKFICDVLCDLLESNNSSLMGYNNCNIPKIVQIFAEIFHKEAIEASSDLGKRIVLLIREIQNDANLFSMCVMSLSPNLQEALHEALSQ